MFDACEFSDVLQDACMLNPCRSRLFRAAGVAHITVSPSSPFHARDDNSQFGLAIVSGYEFGIQVLVKDAHGSFSLLEHHWGKRITDPNRQPCKQVVASGLGKSSSVDRFECAAVQNLSAFERPRRLFFHGATVWQWRRLECALHLL